MVLIICTKNESNLTNKYQDMVPNRQNVWTDGKDGRKERTDRRSQNYIPPTSSGDNNAAYLGLRLWLLINHILWQ